MELTIISEDKQPLYKRTHLTLGITYEAATPSRGEVASTLAEQREVGTDRVAVRSIESRFGGGSARADAYVYDDATSLEQLEQAHLVARTRKGLPESAPAAEAEAAPAEEAAAPAEETAPAEPEAAAEDEPEA